MISFLTILLPLLANSMTFEEASEIIKADLSQYSLRSKSLCSEYHCCNITSTNDCDLSAMTKDSTTLVLPGGDTRCIFSDSTPFAIQVIPGASDKLLLYFQGGGACWDELSTKMQFCSTDSSPQSLVGVFDRNNAENPYSEYTIVHVLYCSGDLFGGDVTRPYNDTEGVPVMQYGLNNAQSALDWIVTMQNKGQLSETFTDLVVSGCSAGSIGAQLWGSHVVKSLKWKKASVLPDSYAGLFPDGVEGPLIYSYGYCDSGFLNTENTKKCNDQQLQLRDITNQNLIDAPNVAYSFIQSKTDIVQESFYIATGVLCNADAYITPSLFYSGVNDIFESYNQHNNFVAYLVDGMQHCFTPSSVFYSADAKGPEDNGSTNSLEDLKTWVESIPLENGDTISTICEGAVQENARVGAADNTYCDSALLPKTFVDPSE